MTALHPLLSRRPAQPAPSLALLPRAPGLELAQARVHEACGPARHSFAAWLAARTEGPVIWVAPAWEHARLNPDGLHGLIDPGRLVFVHPRRSEDILWIMEETLRAGSVALAIADLTAPPGLTAVRRMHLAAETGAAEGAQIPLGVLLTPGAGGAPGVETRWHLAPAHAQGQNGWRLERLRARVAPQHAWDLSATDGSALPRVVAQ